jgi:hypothetical protein
MMALKHQTESTVTDGPAAASPPSRAGTGVLYAAEACRTGNLNLKGICQCSLFGHGSALRSGSPCWQALLRRTVGHRRPSHGHRGDFSGPVDPSRATGTSSDSGLTTHCGL